MGNRHMTSRQAVILAGALAAVILILLIPVWRGVAWSDEVVEDDSQQPATKVAVEATPEDNEDTASGGAVRAVVRVSSGSSIDGLSIQQERPWQTVSLCRKGMSRMPKRKNWHSTCGTIRFIKRQRSNIIQEGPRVSRERQWLC